MVYMIPCLKELTGTLNRSNSVIFTCEAVDPAKDGPTVKEL